MIIFDIDGRKVALHTCEVLAVEDRGFSRQVWLDHRSYETSTTLEDLWKQLVFPYNPWWIRVDRYIIAADRIYEVEETETGRAVAHIGKRIFSLPMSFNELIGLIDKMREEGE